MSLTIISRVAAVAVCLPLGAALVVNSDYRSDNIFAIPDLIGCAVLLVAAFLPRGKSVLPFIMGFAWMAGVVTTAGFARVDGGDGANAVLNFAIAAVYTALAVLWVRRIQTGTLPEQTKTPA